MVLINDKFFFYPPGDIASRILVDINPIHCFSLVAEFHLIIFEMSSISPYQAYSFRCWFSNNSGLVFVVSVLSQDRVPLRSFHSILTFVPEAL